MKTRETTFEDQAGVQRTFALFLWSRSGRGFCRTDTKLTIMDFQPPLPSPTRPIEGLVSHAHDGPPAKPMRVILDIWDATPPYTQDDIHSVVVCVDGEVIGKPLSKEDGCAVFNWLQDALPSLEEVLMEEVERLYEEDMEDSASRDAESSRNPTHHG